MSKKSGGSTESIPNDAEVSSELIHALANNEISADDIEIVKDAASGKSVIRPKSNVSFKSGRSSLKVGHVYKDPTSRGECYAAVTWPYVGLRMGTYWVS